MNSINIGVIDEAGHTTCPYCEQVIGIPNVSGPPPDPVCKFCDDTCSGTCEGAREQRSESRRTCALEAAESFLRDEQRDDQEALDEWKRLYPKFPWKDDHKAIERFNTRQALIERIQAALASTNHLP